MRGERIYYFIGQPINAVSARHIAVAYAPERHGINQTLAEYHLIGRLKRAVHTPAIGPAK